MPRHLTTDQIDSALRRGKSVEQYLQRPAPDQIAWIELRPVLNGIESWRFDAFDDGNEEFFDVYSFSPIDEDWPESPIESHSDSATARTSAEENFSANPGRWVNQFVIQDEYRDDLVQRAKTNGEQQIFTCK